MIKVTDKAKARIMELRNEEGHSDKHNVRVSVKGGGCSGLMYGLDFDDQLKDDDKVYEDKGVKIIVKTKKAYCIC